MDYNRALFFHQKRLTYHLRMIIFAIAISTIAIFDCKSNSININGMNTLISSSKEIGRRIIIPSAKKYSLRNIPDSISVIEVKGILMVESSITLSGKTIDAK